jgi:hypothetical protein
MSSITDALIRYGGMYGQAERNGHLLAEVVTVAANAEIARVNVPLVGQTKQGYKPGRETREGTLTIQKIDTHWELELYQFMSASLAARRAARGTQQAITLQRQFSIVIAIDDPDTWGRESWRLDGCLIWRLPLGFSITDDIVNREFPLTWEDEVPVDAFVVSTDPAGGQTLVPYSPGAALPPF